MVVLLRKIAKTKVTNSSLTTVPKPVKLFLEIESGDDIGWYVNDEQQIIIQKEKRDKGGRS